MAKDKRGHNAVKGKQGFQKTGKGRNAPTVSPASLPRPAKKEHQVWILPPYPNDKDQSWTVKDYDLCDALGVRSNYEAENIVISAYSENKQRTPVNRIVFDSEAGCFFAYTPTKESAEELAKFINNLVKERR